MSKMIKIGISGDKGSFSEEAGNQYIQEKNLSHAELIYLTNMENVLSAVENKEIDIGIFPVVNLRGGLVNMAFEAMGRHLFELMGELWLDVQQCLLVKSGVTTQDITHIASHPQGLAQCKGYIEDNFPNAKKLEWDDTAKAAHDLSKGILPEATGVIAPKGCAELYQLNLLEKAVQDQDDNLTAFVITKKL